MPSQFEHELNAMMESVRAKAHQTSFLLDELTRISGQVGMIMHQANEHAVDELSRLVNNLDNPNGMNPLDDGHMPHVLRGEPAPQQKPQQQTRRMPPYPGPHYDNHPEYQPHPQVNGAAPPPLPDRGVVMAKRKAKPKKPAPKKRTKVQATNGIRLNPQIRIEMDYAPCVYADHIMEVLCIDPDERFADSMGISRGAGELVNQMILSAVQDCMAATLEWARSAN